MRVSVVLYLVCVLALCSSSALTPSSEPGLAAHANIPCPQQAAAIRWCCARFNFVIICATHANKLEPFPAVSAPTLPCDMPASHQDADRVPSSGLDGSHLSRNAATVSTANNRLLGSLVFLEAVISTGCLDPTKDAEKGDNIGIAQHYVHSVGFVKHLSCLAEYGSATQATFVKD